MTKRLKPIHPGEILREEYLKPLGLSMNRLAMDLHVPAPRISNICRGRQAITPDTALRLSIYFKTTARFWMNLQTQYDLEVAQDAAGERIRRVVRQRLPGTSARPTRTAKSVRRDGRSRMIKA